MVKPFSDIGKATSDFASVTSDAGFSWQTKVKGGGYEHVYKSASSTIQQKYKTSYEGFDVAFDDKRKGDKTESKFTVTLPKDTIPDQSVKLSFGVKDVKDSCNIDKGYVSLEYEPCDWMAAVAKYNIAKKDTNVEAVFKYQEFPTCGVAATLGGGAPSNIKVSADGNLTDDFVFGLCVEPTLATKDKAMSCKVNMDVKTAYEGVDLQVGASVPDALKFDAAAVGVTATAQYAKDGATFTAQVAHKGSSNSLYLGSEISMGKGKSTTIFQKYGVNSSAIQYQGMGFALKYDF